ncbi:MAG: CAP domain-containing protein [Sulfitobacter sp.]
MTVATDLERYLLELVNAERAAVGLGALTLELNLNTSAEDHSQWMSDNDTFSHTGVNSSSATQRITDANFDFSGAWRSGENIAAQTIGGAEGYFDEVAALHLGLMNSPGHRANILNPDYTHIGLGIVIGNYSYDTATSYPSVFITQNFAATQGITDHDLLGSASAEAIDAGTGDDVVSAGAGDDTVNGQAGNDTLDGGAGDDTLFGSDGDDLITGGDGADQLNGGTGADILSGQSGNDRILAGTGDDLVHGGAQQDSITGGEGNDTIYGDAGFDLLRGNEGDDLIDGGHQADNIYGDAGNDTLYGSGGFDRLFGGADDDIAYGGTSGDALFGDTGNDTLYGEDGNDRFFGGTGNDLIVGGAGDDNMIGSAGFDTLIGGSGDDLMAGRYNADTFIFEDLAGGFGHDTIIDFNANNNFERIHLSGVSAITDFDDLMQNHVDQVGNSIVITVDENSTVTLLNVELADLDAIDFIF